MAEVEGDIFRTPANKDYGRPPTHRSNLSVDFTSETNSSTEENDFLITAASVSKVPDKKEPLNELQRNSVDVSSRSIVQSPKLRKVDSKKIQLKSAQSDSKEIKVRKESFHSTLESLKEKDDFTASEEPQRNFNDYISGELGTKSYALPVSEGILDLTERERVYNTLIYVPLQYARLLVFGLLLCFDSFLSLFTVMPIRAISYSYIGNQYNLKRPVSKVPKVQNHEVNKEVEKGEGKGHSAPDFLSDILWLTLILLCSYILLQLKTSEVFHYIHAQEVIKLYLVLTMMEIFDKICGSLSFDCLETLASSCSAALGGKSCRGGSHSYTSSGGALDYFRVFLDYMVTLGVMSLHCFILLFEAITFNVVLNAANSSLLALLVSNNFAELKGTVFKNMNVTRLWTLSVQDIVEHFHISICLLFVLIENMLLTNASFPSSQMISQCLLILACEVLVDILKHSFLGKFQNIKPGVYSEYLKDICEKVVSSTSLNSYRIIHFNPVVPGALLLRISIPLLERRWQDADSIYSKAIILASIIAFWMTMLGVKLILGWIVQITASYYLTYYNTTRKFKKKSWLVSTRKPSEKTM